MHSYKGNYYNNIDNVHNMNKKLSCMAHICMLKSGFVFNLNFYGNWYVCVLVSSEFGGVRWPDLCISTTEQVGSACLSGTL